MREKLPKVDEENEDNECQSEDVQIETALGCSNLATVKEMDYILTSYSMIGDKMRKRKRSGRLKYKLKETVMDCVKKEETARTTDEKAILEMGLADINQVDLAHQMEIEDGMGLECGKKGNRGPMGIFDKKNWKNLQQKSTLHTTRKKTNLKRKTKIRSDYTKVGKTGKIGKSVQDIVSFFEKMGGTSQGPSLTMGNTKPYSKNGGIVGTNLTQKCDVGGVEMGVEDRDKYVNIRNGLKRDRVVQMEVEAPISNHRTQ